MLCLQGVGFFGNECVSSQTKNCSKVQAILSDYRNESHQDGLVELREADGTIGWGWTSSGEWLGYSVTVRLTVRIDVSNSTKRNILRTFVLLSNTLLGFRNLVHNLQQGRVAATVKGVD